MPQLVRQCLLDSQPVVDMAALMECINRRLPNETWLDIVHLPGALDAAGCASLRNAVDASRSFEADSVDAMPEHQLDLTRAELEVYLGPSAVAALWKLPRRLLSQRASGVPGEHADEATGPSWMSPRPSHRVQIFVRRYSRDSRPWIGFHCDACEATVNVALASDEAHEGGRLMVALNDGVTELTRAMGEATVHPSSILHAVSAMKAGVRYSLLLFFY